MPLIIAAAVAAELERRRQEGRARPAYRNRYLGGKQRGLERYARELLSTAGVGKWHVFLAADAEDASTVDQCIRYIVRQERPAEAVRVEWLRQGDDWRNGFPRPLDRRGHGEVARIRREVREALARFDGRDAGTFDATELARLERVQIRDDEWCYAGRLRLGPKRGTVSPPASPRPRHSMPETLRHALTGDGQ